MSFTSVLSSILPTIGTVLGALLGADSVEKGVLYYALQNPNKLAGNSTDSGAYFLNDNGEIKLYNPAPLESEGISISFLGRRKEGEKIQYSSESFVLPGFNVMSMNSVFKNYASLDNSKFELAAAVADDEMTEGANSSSRIQMAVTQMGIQASETNPTEASLGSYLKIILGAENATITGNQTMALDTISSLVIKGSGDTAYRFANIQAVDGAVTVSLPEPLLDGDLCEVDISGVLAYDSAQLKALYSRRGIALEKLTLDQHNAIIAAPKLNWMKNQRRVEG